MGYDESSIAITMRSWSLSPRNTLYAWITLFILMLSYFCLQYEPDMPRGMPWIGRRQELCSYLRAKIRTAFNLNKVLREAHHYHKQGRPVAFAHLFSAPQVILPPSMLHWMITQPESVISTDSQAYAVHKWMGTGLDGDNTAPDILRKKLARDLDEKIPILDDEILASLRDLWGTSTEWKAIDLKPSLRVLNARVANRILVGLPACRNEQYLASVMGFTTMHARVTLFYHALPSMLTSLLSGVVGAMTRRYIRQCSQIVLPVLRQRIADVRGGSGSGDKSQPLPSEFLTWLVERFAQRGENLSDLEDSVASHLLVLNIAAIEVTTFALNSAVRDLLRSDKDKHLVPVIKEAEAILGRRSHPEKSDISHMVLIERALKESLRRGVQVGFMRQVVAPQGVDLADGTHLPCGTRVSISALGIHFDDDNYEDASTWNPNRREWDTTGPIKAGGSDVTLMNRPTESYLSFGLGRRACPGRFIVSYQLRLTVARIFAKYDIKVVKEKVGKERDVVYIRCK